MYRLTFLFALFSPFLQGNGQQPAHFILGENELAGTDIYSITQDNDNNYWLATNRGIIKYDGYDFQSITSQELLGSAVFGWAQNSDGKLYCFNFSGQVIEVDQDTCRVFYQIPDNLMSNEISIAFDDQDALIVASAALFRVRADSHAEILYASGYHYSSLFQTHDGAIVTHNLHDQVLLTISHGTFSTRPFTYATTTGRSTVNLIYLDDSLHYYDRHSSRIIDMQARPFSLHPQFIPNQQGAYRFYSDGNQLWAARLSGGVQLFDANLNPLFGGRVLFESDVISSLHVDHEGNILLGTFSGGIIAVLNNELVNVTSTASPQRYTKLTSDGERVFVGTQSGRVMVTEGQLKLLRDEQIKNIEVLEYIEPTNELLLDERIPVLVDLSSGQQRNIAVGAIKDMHRVGKDYFLATNLGVTHFSMEQSNTIDGYDAMLQQDEPECNRLTAFDGRTNCVAYDPKTETVYAGTPNGLRIGTKQATEALLFEGREILCRDIIVLGDRVILATQGDGLLIIKERQLQDQWNTTTGLISNSINKVVNHHGLLYISSENGLMVLDEYGLVQRTLTSADGLHSDNSSDFEIVGNDLWVVSQKGIQSIPIDLIQPFDFTPVLDLVDVTVNEQPVTGRRFSYDENRFLFTLSAPSLRYQSDITYHYRLVGSNDSWQVSDYRNNSVAYQSLPPGEYIFEAKAVSRGNASALITFRFTIAKPFWSTWWFYVLIALVLLAVATMVFIVLGRRQRKRLEMKGELDASKLTAIKSQMNPHFIFNALNSIQDLVLKGDAEHAYSYISKFASLVRRTLNDSDKDFIEFSQEMRLIELYLTLEKLRFKEELHYEINRNAIEDILVPPLLIQPFIENALVHGLLHKDGQKKLTIDFELNDQLHCTITDNGIGRKRAQEIAERKPSRHESFSGGAIKKRFEILQDHFGKDLGFAYADLEENNEPVGTQVTLRIPTKRSF